jgi:hypothetical protein
MNFISLYFHVKKRKELGVVLNTCNPRYARGVGRRIIRLYLENECSQKRVDMAQVVEHLCSKQKVLHSNTVLPIKMLSNAM